MGKTFDETISKPTTNQELTGDNNHEVNNSIKTSQSLPHLQFISPWHDGLLVLSGNMTLG